MAARRARRYNAPVVQDPRRVPLELLGERVELLPEGCVLWRRRRTLIAADWPAPARREDVGRLARAVFETGAERVLLVGAAPGRLQPGLSVPVESADGLAEGDFVFRSRPAAYPDRFVWCGHLRPLHAGRPAFYLRPETGVLPAFAADGEGVEIRPVPGESLYVIEGGCVTQALPPGRSAAPF